MRILVWTAHFLPHIGGVEGFSARLWPRLVTAGHQVQLITCNTNGATDQECIEGVNVLRLKCINLLRSRYPVPILRNAKRLWRKDQFDVIVTNTRFFLTSFAGARIALRSGCPYVHMEHGSGWRVSENPGVNLVTRLVDVTIGRWLLRNATIVCAVSRDAARYCRSLVDRDVRILPNAIDTELFSRPAQRLPICDDVPADHVVLLFAGRLIKAKGFLEFLELAERLQNEKLLFLVAGVGPLSSLVVERAQSNPKVKYLGGIPAERMPQVYQAADIVCHPSYCLEGLPTVILEAGAAGCAVVAARTSGVEEIIPSAQFGTVIAPRDVGQLAQAVITLLNNPTLRASLANNLKSRVREVFDIRVIAARMEEILREAIHANKRQSFQTASWSKGMRKNASVCT